VKARLLAFKLQAVVAPRLYMVLEAIYDYSSREINLSVLESNHLFKKNKNTKHRYFYEWLILFEQREQMAMLDQNWVMLLQKKAFKALESYRLS